MKIHDPVHLYEGEWFNEGRITAVSDEWVEVDFIDWVQRFQPTELRVDYVFFKQIWVPIAPGVCVQDFRD